MPSRFESAFEAELDAVPRDHFDRSRFVPAVGPLDADVMLVGEAPGEREVERGEPFVGQAGRVLDEALDEIGVERTDLYITNVVKVRPPNNRSPRAAEVDAWRGVLEAEVERVDPSAIVTLGNAASRAFLGSDVNISDVRGRRFEVNGRSVFPTFHPAAVFYDSEKRDALQGDLERAFERIG